MGRFVTVQSNFSSGEIDPRLRARLDINQYYNAASTLQNVAVQPQGGIKRRPGSIYLSTLGGTPSDGVRCVPFEFSVTDAYMLVFVGNRMYVFKNKALVTDINGATDVDYLDTSSYGLTGARVAEMNWTQSADTLIIVHEDIQPVKIVRGATDADWTISNVTFASVPLYNYVPYAYNPATTLTPSAVSGNITLTAGAGTFDTDDIGQYVNAFPQGRAKIVDIQSATVVEARVEYPFFDTTAIAANDWELEQGYEDVWSATRGWPRSVTFHEGRLFFGGSYSRPSTVWGSKVGLFFDFDPEGTLDDDAVEATLDTNQLNVITDIHSGRDLQIFTTGGEFYVPQSDLTPITPTTFFIKAAGRSGSKPSVRVLQLDSGTIFLQRQGEAINEFLYSDTTLSYVTNRISLLSGHLLKAPTAIAMRRGTQTDEGDLLLAVNSTDGTIAAWTMVRSQNIVAGFEWVTDGSYVDVAVAVTDIYAVVKRTIVSTDYYFVEVFDESYFTDAALSVDEAVSSATVAHLAGEVVNVILDGAPQADETADPSSGLVTFDRASTTTWEIGLEFNPTATTMPIEPKLQVGPRTGFKKRVVEVSANLYQTQNMLVNGIPVAFRNLNAAILDEDVPEFTGIKRVSGIRGWSRTAQITITQDQPLKFNLLGLEYRVSVYQGT